MSALHRLQSAPIVAFSRLLMGLLDGLLAQVLPQIINQMTPNGQVPADHAAVLKQALSALSRRS
jgi:hypothetical protein